jgi:hypothetical protein
LKFRDGGTVTSSPSTPTITTAEVVSNTNGQPVKQATYGTDTVVAAWLRAVANQLDPPKPAKPVMRGRDAAFARAVAIIDLLTDEAYDDYMAGRDTGGIVLTRDQLAHVRAFVAARLATEPEVMTR